MDEVLLQDKENLYQLVCEIRSIVKNAYDHEHETYLSAKIFDLIEYYDDLLLTKKLP